MGKRGTERKLGQVSKDGRMDGRQESRGNFVVTLAAWYPKVYDYRAFQNSIRLERSKLKETVRRLFVFFRPVVLAGLQSRQDKRGAGETGGD